MRADFIILLLLLNDFEASGENEHVHFKIYVPELIKHHIHTRTVYIHVHHPPKKKPYKNPYIKNYHENWSSYRYKNHNGYGIDQSNPIYHPGLLTNNYLQAGELYDHPVPPIPFYDDYRGDFESIEDSPDPTIPPKINFGQGVTGYSYPPQYETHEDVDDVSPNEIDSYEDKVEHEEGHKVGHQINTGHIYTDERNKIYGDGHEESSEKYVNESNEEKYGYYGDRYVSNVGVNQHGSR